MNVVISLDSYNDCTFRSHNDIVLVAHTVGSMRAMLQICEIFAVEYDVKFNAVKSVVAMRIGAQFSIMCAPLMLGGMN